MGGQLLMEEEWTPLIMVAGTQDEFGSVANFSDALVALDRETRITPDNSSVSVVWAGQRIEFFPNTEPNRYTLPKVNGITIDVGPDFTYMGAHLSAKGRYPDVVTTNFENNDGSYEVAYDFRTGKTFIL